MPPDPGDLFAPYLWAQELLTCACEALTDHASGGCPERACVYNGGIDVAFDDDCAQLWVSWDSTFPTVRFPQQLDATEITKCFTQGMMLAIIYEVGIVRCAPTMDSLGRSPTCEEIDASAQQMHEDATVLRRAVLCCLAEWDGDRSGNRAAWLEQVPIGDQGGLVGSTLRVVIGMPNCVCLPEVGS